MRKVTKFHPKRMTEYFLLLPNIKIGKILPEQYGRGSIDYNIVAFGEALVPLAVLFHSVDGTIKVGFQFNKEIRITI